MEPIYRKCQKSVNYLRWSVRNEKKNEHDEVAQNLVHIGEKHKCSKLCSMDISHRRMKNRWTMSYAFMCPQRKKSSGCSSNDHWRLRHSIATAYDQRRCSWEVLFLLKSRADVRSEYLYLLKMCLRFDFWHTEWLRPSVPL